MLRVQFSDPSDWKTFISGCFDGTETGASDAGTRRLQEGGSVTNAEDKNVTIYFDDNVPDETLVCDLFYEKDW